MKVNTTELLFILENTPAEQNIMLVGKHGIGKSRILEDYYQGKNCRVVTLFLGQMSDPGDLIGLPEKNTATGKTDFLLPYWFPTDGKPVVLFLDELNRARPEVLQTIMDLTLNRKLAGKTLPPGSRIISAVNSGNEYQLTDLDPALVSRFNIYDFEPTVEDWLNWAKNTGLDQRIIAFISENAEFLDGDSMNYGSENLEPSPDRRKWERVSKIITAFPSLSDLHKPIIAGIIGNRAASVFFRFINDKKSITASQILCAGFENTVSMLEKATTPELCLLNTAIFNYIETSNSSTQNKTVSASLERYFDWLTSRSLKECVNHFISLFNAESYPNALCFIGENCPALYEKIMNAL